MSTYHVKSSIESLLKLTEEQLGVLFNMNGKEARQELLERQAKGDLYVGSERCKGFDPKKGCPGHNIDDEEPMTLKHQDQIIANQVAGMPLEEAIFQTGYTSGHDAGYEKGKREALPEAHVSKETVDEEWESFWKPIVCNEDGTINIEQLKKELADFSFIMEQVPKVYCHITGSRMSKIMYQAVTVIRVSDDHLQELVEEAVKDELGEREETGAVWVKASERLPGWRQPVKWRIDGIERKVNDVLYMAHDECSAHLPNYEWLDESLAAGRQEEDPQELWDEHSEYIENDIDSCQSVAGSSVMTEANFKKAMAKINKQKI